MEETSKLLPDPNRQTRTIASPFMRHVVASNQPYVPVPPPPVYITPPPEPHGQHYWLAATTLAALAFAPHANVYRPGPDIAVVQLMHAEHDRREVDRVAAATVAMKTEMDREIDSARHYLAGVSNDVLKKVQDPETLADAVVDHLIVDPIMQYLAFVGSKLINASSKHRKDEDGPETPPQAKGTPPSDTVESSTLSSAAMPEQLGHGIAEWVAQVLLQAKHPNDRLTGANLLYINKMFARAHAKGDALTIGAICSELTITTQEAERSLSLGGYSEDQGHWVPSGYVVVDTGSPVCA